MKAAIFFISLFIFLEGCTNQNNLSPEQKKVEIEKIKSRIEAFFAGYEKKDMDEIMSALTSSNEFSFFGSDVSEMGTSKAEFQNQMDMDWKLFEKASFSNIKVLSTFISEDGTLASSLVSTTFNVVISETQSSFTFRSALTFTNENGIWKILQASFSVPSVGQSSAELVQEKLSKTQ